MYFQPDSKKNKKLCNKYAVNNSKKNYFTYIMDNVFLSAFIIKRTETI